MVVTIVPGSTSEYWTEASANFGIELIDEKLSTAIRLGLGSNSTLESQGFHTLNRVMILHLCGWRPFFFTHQHSQDSSHVFWGGVTKSHAAAICVEVLAIMLHQNKSLETLSMVSDDARLGDYLLFVEAIQPNTTLVSGCMTDFYVNEDETKKIIGLKKNYGLEELPGLHHGAGDITPSLS
jgi:hypothetical protein